MTFHAAFPSLMEQKTFFSLPEQTFDFLETPEYYFDGYHLNAKGRQRFTETLVAELMGRLRSADSPADLNSEAKAVAGQTN
jgi:lysophospholipase L1-like esterase